MTTTDFPDLLATLAVSQNDAFARGIAAGKLQERNRVREAIDMALTLLEGYEDVVDSDNGPRPNNAMRARHVLEAALGRRSA